MFRSVFILTLFSILLSCTGDDDLGAGTYYTFEVTNPASPDQAERVEFEYNRYSNFSLQQSIVDSDQAFSELLADIKSKAQGVGEGVSNPYEQLHTALVSAEVDFDLFNLFVYIRKESSGSINITPLTPEMDSTGEYVFVYIDRSEPNVGDAAVAQHTLLYKVSKAVKEVHFHNGPHIVEYKNIKGGMDKPLNCQSLDWCKDKQPEPLVEEISVPFREHGYNNFNTMIISDQNTLDEFTKGLYSQDGWNSVNAFVEPLLGADIRFDRYNLLLYRITENSGSIVLNPWAPAVNEDIVEVKITGSAPDIGTDDMAYYALAYKIEKSIKEIHFVGGSSDVVIENQAGTNIAPLNCQSWNDGCNECFRDELGLASCTEKACPVNGTLYCKEWK